MIYRMCNVMLWGSDDIVLGTDRRQARDRVIIPYMMMIER